VHIQYILSHVPLSDSLSSFVTFLVNARNTSSPSGVNSGEGPSDRKHSRVEIVDVRIEGKVMPARDSKAALGEGVVASPVHDGPIEGDKFMGIREERLVECARKVE
jgi:hypothetical protein